MPVDFTTSNDAHHLIIVCNDDAYDHVLARLAQEPFLEPVIQTQQEVRRQITIIYRENPRRPPDPRTGTLPCLLISLLLVFVVSIFATGLHTIYRWLSH